MLFRSRFTGFLDLTTASVATEAVLAAVLERELGGAGQKVEVSMLEAALEIQSTRIAEYLGGGLIPQPRGSESSMLAPDRAFATLDHEVFVTAHNGAEFAGFCRALELPQLAEDARFRTNRLRVENRDALTAEVAPVFLKRPAIWWQRVMQREGVACTQGFSFETFRHHQQVVENDMIANVATRDWGTVSVAGMPWHFARTPCAVREPPRPAEDTAAVMADLAARRQKGAA